MKQFFNLKGKAAIVTGGGTGIGKGCAIVLAQAGASVMVVGRRMEKLQETKAAIEKEGGICECYSADLMVEENCKAVIDACIAKFGSVDVLINSAGGRGANGNLEEEFSAENLKHTMDMDFNSTFNCIKYAYPKMQEQGKGSIINIASLAALSARGPIVYSAAKGAIKSMSKTLAKRFGLMGIRVNTIYPGIIITEMTEKLNDMPELAAKLKADSALNAFGDVFDIGYCALYLASDESKFVTGQDFVVDGGAMCL